MVCECKYDDGLLDSSESDISCIDFVSKLKKQPSIFESLMIRSNLVECLRTFGLDINQNDEGKQSSIMSGQIVMKVVSYVLGTGYSVTRINIFGFSKTVWYTGTSFFNILYCKEPHEDYCHSGNRRTSPTGQLLAFLDAVFTSF